MPVTVRFRERMCGPVREVHGGQRWRTRPRGPAAGEDVPGLVGRLTAPPVSGRVVLDLDRLDVHVTGTDRHDGYRADVVAGVVRGLADAPLPVVLGYADVLARTAGRRTMHYRLLVYRPGAGDVPAAWLLVEGVKTVRGGVRGVVRATTTLATVVVAVPTAQDPVGRFEAGGSEGTVVAAGTLRVRGLVRQACSMRGAVLPFLLGFLRRALFVQTVDEIDGAR